MQVRELLEGQILHKNLKQRAADLFTALKNEDLQQQHEEMEAKVTGLNKAYDVFEKLHLV